MLFVEFAVNDFGFADTGIYMENIIRNAKKYKEVQRSTKRTYPFASYSPLKKQCWRFTKRVKFPTTL